MVATLLRSTVVRESTRFAAREFAAVATVARYHLRSSGRTIYLRHRTADVVTLDEIFYQRQYELSEQVRRRASELGRPLRVLDLGANIGLFGVFILERVTPADLTAVEPNPANLHLLKLTASANADGTWRIVPAAAFTREGTVPFVFSEYSLSHIPGAGETSDTDAPAIDALPLLARSDLAKIDIEGGEWALLADPRLEEAGPRDLVLEYHPHLCPSDNPREAVQTRLGGLGYDVDVVHEPLDGYGVAWATRDRH